MKIRGITQPQVEKESVASIEPRLTSFTDSESEKKEMSLSIGNRMWNQYWYWRCLRFVSYLFYVSEIIVGRTSRELVEGNAAKRGCQDFNIIRFPSSCMLTSSASQHMLRLLAPSISGLSLKSHSSDSLKHKPRSYSKGRRRCEQEPGTCSSESFQRLMPSPTFQASSRVHG